MELSAKETRSIIRYYSEQKRRLLGEMKHVEQVLRKLKGQSQDEATGVRSRDCSATPCGTDNTSAEESAGREKEQAAGGDGDGS